MCVKRYCRTKARGLVRAGTLRSVLCCCCGAVLRRRWWLCRCELRKCVSPLIQKLMLRNPTIALPAVLRECKKADPQTYALSLPRPEKTYALSWGWMASDLRTFVELPPGLCACLHESALLLQSLRNRVSICMLFDNSPQVKRLESRCSKAQQQE